jgi:hypothetical protein
MAIPSRQIGGSTRTSLLWQISKQLEELICVRSGGCGPYTTTTTSTIIPSINLGCVYNNNVDALGNPLELYNVSTNTSTQVVIPTGNEFTNFAETHTQNKYWKGNQTSLIREWVPTSVPNVLEINRNITVTGIISPFGNYFTFLEAVDDNHLLTIVYNAPLFTNILTLLDITSGAVTASEITPLFNIYAPNGLDSFILTTTNKIIAIGRRDVGPATSVYFLTQYSYPDGALELELNISSTLTYSATTRPQLFQSGDGNIYIFAGNNTPGNEFSTIFEIDLNSPYTITPIWSNLGLYLSLFNSSVNCNTVNLNITTTTSTTLAPTGFNTIYTHFESL